MSENSRCEVSGGRGSLTCQDRQAGSLTYYTAQVVQSWVVKLVLVDRLAHDSRLMRSVD